MESRAVMAKSTVDGGVIRACQEGDRDAFRLLFEAYKDKVFSIALYSFSGDEAAASDVTQQTFLKLMNSINQFRGDSEFTTWLYRLVVNACIDEQRRRKRFLPWEASMPMNKTAEKRPQEKYFARVEISEAVKVAISQLKPTFRLPILLKYIEELSYEEIAAVMNCSKGTVASRLNRGHRQLALRLSYLRDQIVLGD
jgi:RNA polymerase sigma-70 factor (ECF subfamily)